MSQSTNQLHHENSLDRVYGFMDQTTNVFYAFDSYEEYRCFLEWMQHQNDSPADSTHLQNIREEQMLEDERKATEDIMSVFDDSFFTAKRVPDCCEMMEIDF